MKKYISSEFIRTLSNVILVLIALVFVEACSHVAPYGTGYSGKIQDEIYSSPRNTFQVRVPPLLKPGAIIADRQLSEGFFRVAMSDDLCRVFAVTEITVDPTKVSLDTFVDRFNASTKGGEATVIERKKIATAFGEGVYVRSSFTEGGPCTIISFVDGKRKESEPPAEGAIIFLQSGQRIYSIEYLLGGDTDWPFIKTGPVDNVLMNYFEGFRILN